VTAGRREVKTRREDEDEKREERLQFSFPAEEKLPRKLDQNNQAAQSLPRKFLMLAIGTKRALAALLISIHFPQFISFVPFGGGCTRHASGLKAGRASFQHPTCILSP